MKQDAINSLLEQREKKRHDDMLRQFEIDTQKQQAHEQNKLYSRKRRNQQITKAENEKEYHKFLSQQVLDKQRKFVDAKTENYDKQEVERQRYFDRLKEFQKANDLKQEMLQKYMSQDSANLNSKKDEEAYLRHIEHEKVRAQQKAERDQQLRLKRKQDNLEVLDRQIREKQHQQLSRLSRKSRFLIRIHLLGIGLAMFLPLM